MKKAILYFSATGTTAAVASQIAEVLNIDKADVFNIESVEPAIVADYDVLILGTPTLIKGELPGRWIDFSDALQVLSLRDKKIALFGTGDSNMKESFCDAVGILYDRLSDTKADFIGEFNTFPYQFDYSKAVKIEGAGAVGLLIDNVNFPNETSRRIKDWANSLKL